MNSSLAQNAVLWVHFMFSKVRKWLTPYLTVEDPRIQDYGLPVHSFCGCHVTLVMRRVTFPTQRTSNAENISI